MENGDIYFMSCVKCFIFKSNFLKSDMIAGDERFVIFLQTITLKVHLPTFSGPETLKGVPIPDSYGIPEYRADQISG